MDLAKGSTQWLRFRNTEVWGKKREKEERKIKGREGVREGETKGEKKTDGRTK